MNECSGFVNIYRSGWFHRADKPCAYNRHPGDIYPTKEEAMRDIEPKELYVTTVPIAWQEAGDVRPNPVESVPEPLFKQRSQMRQQYGFAAGDFPS